MSAPTKRRTRAALHALRGIPTPVLESGGLEEALKLARDATSLLDAGELIDREPVRIINAVVRRRSHRR